MRKEWNKMAEGKTRKEWKKMAEDEKRKEKERLKMGKEYSYRSLACMLG